MRIAIDVMGGDYAPEAALAGCFEALETLGADTELVLFGNEAAISAALEQNAKWKERIRVVPTTEVIGCDEQPTLALRRKKNSSMARAIASVAAGETDCIVSAGSTGALLTGATLTIKRQKGVKRPALAVVLPASSGCTLLVDCGANTDCKPQYLQQFAVMGRAYMEGVMHIENPRIGLLSNGAEAEKGNELTKAAHALLTQTPVNFTGNCEARDVLSGAFDVVVADGFDGNAVLKSIEGTAGLMMQMLKTYLMEGPVSKFGAVLAKPAFRKLKRKLDYSEYGGAPLLGVAGGVIKAHGSSNAKAFRCAILQAERLIAGNVLQIVGDTIAAIPVED